MNLDLKQVKAKMANAKARFAQQKKEALAHDAAIVQRQKLKDGCLNEMNVISGEYKALRQIAVDLGDKDPDEKGVEEAAALPSNRAERRKK